MVCVPTGKDQPANAARVCGAGVAMMSHGGLSGVFKATVSMLSSLSKHQACSKRLKQQLLAHGGASTGVDFIEGIVQFGFSDLLLPEYMLDRPSWALRVAVIMCMTMSALVVYTGMVAAGLKK